MKTKLQNFKLKTIMAFMVLFASGSIMAQGYKIGDKAQDFTLKNIDGKMVSLSDFSSQKGVILIFTCNHCPYSIAYQDRIIALDKKYKKLGYPVLAINPNDAVQYPEDSYENMIVRAREKGFEFPYLIDEKQDVFPLYGATKTPHVYLLQKDGLGFKVAYIGAIDDSAKDESAVKETYLANAIDALLAGKTPNPTETKAIGCSIKVKL